MNNETTYFANFKELKMTTNTNLPTFPVEDQPDWVRNALPPKDEFDMFLPEDQPDWIRNALPPEEQKKTMNLYQWVVVGYDENARPQLTPMFYKTKDSVLDDWADCAYVVQRADWTKIEIDV